MNISSLSKKSKSKLKGANDLKTLEENYINLLGRNGEINLLLKNLGNLPQNQRKKSGKALNELKTSLEEIFQARRASLKEKIFSEELKRDSLDVTLPGVKAELGTLHPVTSTILEISEFFIAMGFDVRSGPEALRTHTSPVQVRTMEKQGPPIRIICPGRVYRKDSDLTHTPMFHQIEGLVIEENASFSVLKGMLSDFINNYFGKDMDLRFRPSYFPFTEPSAEVDIKWKKGWLEILGCGMVHPNVLEMSGINSKKYSGFAFGLGPERMAMLKYDIPDLRSFFENDLRFLKQFK